MKAAHEDKESLTGGGERRSWRELQLPVSIAMRKQGRRGEAEVRREGDEMEGGTARRRFREGAEDGGRAEELATEGSARRKAPLTGRDPEVRHGSPRLATGDCHPQGHLESAQEQNRTAGRELLKGGLAKFSVSGGTKLLVQQLRSCTARVTVSSEKLSANLEMDPKVLDVLKGLHGAPHKSCTRRKKAGK